MSQSVVMGVDVGGTKILTGLVDERGEVLYSQKFPTDRTDQKSVLSSIDTAIDQFMAHLPAGLTSPSAIGIGLVGLADPQTGVWVSSMNLRIQSPVPLAELITTRYGLPVFIDNDVHAAAMAELKLGIGRKSENFIYVNAGTGIAAGIVCNGRLVRGAANYAGEMGHIFVEPNGDRCVCGQLGCLEPLASGGGILDRVRARLPQYPDSALVELEQAGKLDVTNIFKAADRQDELASLVAGQAIEMLGRALTGVINLLNPEYIILGGGVFSGDWAIQRVRQYIAAHSLPIAYRSLQGIIPSDLQVDRVGLLGAASLAWQ